MNIERAVSFLMCSASVYILEQCNSIIIFSAASFCTRDRLNLSHEKQRLKFFLGGDPSDSKFNSPTSLRDSFAVEVCN